MKNGKIVLAFGILVFIILSGCNKKTDLMVENNKTVIEISNRYGNVKIEDVELANQLIEVLKNKSNMERASCGFGNQTKIIKNNQIVKEFIIADDGCPSIKVNNTIFVMPNNIYNKIENIIQNNKNSLANSVGKPHLLDEKNFYKSVMFFEYI
jgi:hypothetical protein